MATPFRFSDHKDKTKRILVIDDDKDVAITFKALLEEVEKGKAEKEDDSQEEGKREEQEDNNNKTKEFEVDVFNDPEMALSNFKAGKYDLLLLDIVMPKMNGFELYEKMKNIDNKVKVCFVTAYNINYDAIRDLFPTIAEVDCFIRKPIEQKELKSRIREELNKDFMI